MNAPSVMDIWMNAFPQFVIIAIVFLFVRYLNKRFSKFMDLHMKVSLESLKEQKQVAQSLKEIKELLEKK